MEQNQTFFEAISRLYPGAIVDANGEIAVIIDVLRSTYTDAVCLFVRFPRNVGNARPYDVLEVSPQRTFGVEHWMLASREQLEERLEARRDWLDGEIEKLLQVAKSIKPKVSMSQI